MEPEKEEPTLEPEEAAEESGEAPVAKRKKSLEGPSRASARVKTTPSKFKEATPDEKESNGEVKKPRKRKEKEGKKEKEGGKKEKEGGKKEGKKDKEAKKEKEAKSDKKISEKKGDESAKKKRKAKVEGGEEKPAKEKKPRKKKTQEASEDSDKLFCCNAKYDNSKEYIGCSKEKACKGVEWFHVECVGLTHAQVAKLADWFCDACKKADAEAAEAATRQSSSLLDMDADLPEDDLGEGDLPEDDGNW